MDGWRINIQEEGKVFGSFLMIWVRYKTEADYIWKESKV